MRTAAAPVALLLLAALAGCVEVRLAAEPPPSAEPAPRGLLLGFRWAPEPPRAGQAVRFDLDVRSPEAGDRVASVAWSFGDGAASAQREPVHAFASAGDHAVSVTVRTDRMGAATHRETVRVLPAAAGPLPPGAAPALLAAAPPALHASLERNVVRVSFEAPYAPDAVGWDFGDGATSNATVAEHAYLAKGAYTITLRLLAGGAVASNSTRVTVAEVPFQPHVIVAVPDTGINPYHAIYHRPERTAHPCTYIERFPCGIPALELTLGGPDWQAAFEADRHLWQAIRPGQAYWIPRTVFVAVLCEEPYVEGDPSQDLCILDDSHMHGTGTTSSVLMENPDALIAFKEGGSGVQAFLDAGIPADVFSVSWGYPVTLPLGPGPLPWLYVKSSGNDGRSALVDGWNGQPAVVSVGGAYAEGRSEEAMAGKHPEIVSYFCRPTAQTRSVDALRESYCGTSFAAPTAAGALSKVVLAARRASGHTGSGMPDGVVDPVLGLTVQDLRRAMNLTASYEPASEYPSSSAGVPLNPAAPWLQWGWGFYDGTVAEATIAHLLHGAPASKPLEAQAYMEAQMAAKKATHPL